MNSQRPEQRNLKPTLWGGGALALVSLGYLWIGAGLPLAAMADPPAKGASTSKPADDRPAPQKREADGDRGRPSREDEGSDRRWRPRWQERRDSAGRRPRRGGPDDRGVRRGDFPPPDDRRGGPDDFELPPEAIEELEELARTEMPFLYERLQAWKERNPDRFHDAMLRIYPAFRDYLFLKNRNPELAKTVIEELRLEVEIRRLSEQYQSAAEGSAERKQFEEQLAQKVKRQLDIRIARREDRLAELEKKLQREKDKLASDKSKLDAACAQRLKQIKKGKFTDFFEGPPPGRPGPRGPHDGPDGDGDRDFRPPPHGPDDEMDDGPRGGGRPPRGRFGPPPRDQDEEEDRPPPDDRRP